MNSTCTSSRAVRSPSTCPPCGARSPPSSATPSGVTATVQTNRLAWYWDHPPADGIDRTKFAARVSGSFVPDLTGEWELGVRAVGPVSVRLDGETVVELAEAQRGGAFFGLGSPEVRNTVTLEDGRPYELTIDYPLEDGLVRGLVVGARPVPAGDHLELAAAAARAVDVAVVIVGTDDDWETEGEDRSVDGPARRPGRPRPGRGRCQSADDRRPERRVSGLDAVAGRRPGRAAAVVPGAGDRRRAGRRPDRSGSSQAGASR